MRRLSSGGRLVAIVALIASAFEIAQGNVTPSAHPVTSRQDSSGSNPESSKFLRRSGGVVAVLGDRIYYDGGSVSESGPADRLPHRPTNTTLYIDLSTSWSIASVSISEREEPDLPAMASPAILTDESSGCFYVWGHGIPAPVFPELWRFCDNGGGNKGAWEEVDLPSDSEFGKYPGMSHAAYASTNTTGFAFGGRRDWKDFSDKYMTFDFKTKAWASHVLPGPLTATEDHTLWGARAVFVPNYGRNGLVFLLGGVRGGVNDGDAYPTFRTIYFMDPVTNRWYTQDTTATGDGFPEGRTGPCLVGVAGANNTYEIYMFGGANNYERKAYDDLYVLSLPSFTWSLAGKVGKGDERYGHACALVGNSQLLTWGGLRFGEWRDTYLIPDTFRQGLGIFDLNTLEWASGYDAEAAPYRAHSKVVDARSTRPTPAVWSPDVRDFFETSATELPGEDENGKKNENGPEPSSATPVGAIVGGVIGGVALIAIAAVIWFFVARRRGARTRSPQVAQEQDLAADKTQYKPVPELVSTQYVAEMHEDYQPAEMTGQGKEPPRPVYEMDGGYNSRS